MAVVRDETSDFSEDGMTQDEINLLILSIPKPTGALTRVAEEVFAMEVLSFLTVRDLSAFSVCSKYCYEMANDGYLWQSLVARDFLINPNQEVVCLDDHHIQDSKELYVAQYQSLHKKNELFSYYRLAIAKRQMRRKEVEIAENCVDTLLVRVFTPLPVVLAFVSVVLWALYVDGYDISIWICMAPMLLLFFYSGVTAVTAYAVYRNNLNKASVFYGMWRYLRGPFFIIASNWKRNPAYVGVLFSTFTLLLSQVLMLALKLSDATDAHVVPLSVPSSMPWGVVFLPVWLVAAGYLVLPCLGVYDRRSVSHVDRYSCSSPHFVFFVVAWLPLVTTMVIVTTRLAYEDKHKNHPSAVAHEGDGNVSLRFAFIPLWFVELLFLALSLLNYLSAAYRRRRSEPGSPEAEELTRARQAAISTWSFLGPITVFEALAAWDDHNSDMLSAVNHITVPLLVMFGWYALFLTAFAYRMQTPLQTRREALHLTTEETLFVDF